MRETTLAGSAVHAVAVPVDEMHAVFRCRSCGETVAIESWDFFNPPGRALEVECPCGHWNRTVLEHRAHMRKETNISGIYRSIDGSGGRSGSMTVRNISWQGFKLEISAYGYGIHEHYLHCDGPGKAGGACRSIFAHNRLQAGDQLTVEFVLDDPKMSFVSRDVVIRWAALTQVGVELCRPAAFDPAVRFYLLGLKTA